MVTHDVGLKIYANRILRVIDGKINNIETVDEKLRLESIE